MTEIVRPDDMRRQNRTKILAALRSGGNLSRTEIGQNTGLSAATVSAITADLIASEVLLRLEDTDQASAGRGRPRVALTFNPDFSCIATIVLQLNEISVSIVGYQGTTIHEDRIEFATTTCSGRELLQNMVTILDKGLNESKPGVLKHITVGVQGITDVSNTMMMWSPITTSREIPIQKHLKERFGVPVSVHNDCNMIARALRRSEPDLYNADFAAILLSHGIGMGLYHNGKLVKGTHSSATEFGHMAHITNGALCRCGRSGCIEAYAGDYAIYRKAGNEASSSPPHDHIHQRDMEEISARARNNDPDAIAAFEEAGIAIGAGIASLFALFDPFPVAFVGAGAAAHDLLEQSIEKAIGTSHPDLHGAELSLRYYPEDRPLVQKGCAITALMEVDRSIRSNKAMKKAKDIKIAG